MSNQNLHKILGGSGFGLLSFGLIGTWFLFPMIIESQIHANIDLKEGTMGYDTWKKQPFPLKFKVYFFNVTNAAEVQMGAKPIVKEMGPYIYDEYREKVNIEVEEDKDVLKYILKKYYYFNKKESGYYDENDIVTIINPALVGTALQVEIMLPTAMSMVNDAVPYLYPGAKDIFLTTKVKDVLFGGVTIHCTDPEVEFICGAMKGTLPKTIQVAPNGKDFVFSMFRHLNGTDSGPWEMERGIKNTTRGEVLSYEGEEVLDIWQEDSICNMINGSDSTVFERLPKKRPERIYSFSDDFCRSLYIEYEKESEQFGIKAARYVNKAGPLNYDVDPDMKCFCPLVEDDDGEESIVCPPNGLADVTACMKAPVLMSFPHFYLGDPKLREYVSGLNPQKDLHEIYANLEPTTASPLSGQKRVQLNILVKPIENFNLLENVTRGIFPIIWVDEGVILPDDFVKILSSNFLKIKIVNAMKVIMIIAGLGLSVAGGVLAMKKERMLCFSNMNNADITVLKPKPSNPSAERNNSTGTANPAFEGGPPNNAAPQQNGRNGPGPGAANWNVQVWHSGDANRNHGN